MSGQLGRTGKPFHQLLDWAVLLDSTIVLCWAVVTYPCGENAGLLAGVVLRCVPGNSVLSFNGRRICAHKFQAQPVKYTIGLSGSAMLGYACPASLRIGLHRCGVCGAMVIAL